MFERSEDPEHEDRKVGIQVIALLIVVAIILIALAVWSRLRDRRRPPSLSPSMRVMAAHMWSWT